MHFYSQSDLNYISELIEKNKFKKLFITGNMNVGKSSFCKEFIQRFKECKHIEIDKERENDLTKDRSEVLSGVINRNNKNFYILDHYDLLNTNYYLDYSNPDTLSVWRDEADILILLDPERESGESGVREKFNKLHGIEIYQNQETGTFVKSISKNNHALSSS